jgi:diamine N-acetyltransferase
MFVTLREITAETVRDICKLKVKPDQEGFVAPNAVSLAQALFSPEAWYRAIYADDTPVGFVMVFDESLRIPTPPTPEIGLWRFMIDEAFQGKGIGAQALEAVIAHVRSKGIFTALQVSYVPGEGCPEPFYRQAGFKPTGKVDGGEIVLELKL